MTDGEEIGEPECVSRDARGWIYKMSLPKGREAIMIFTRKGMARGGEWHESDQHDVILHGKLLWRFRNEEEARISLFTQEAGVKNAQIWKAKQVHMAEALEDTLYFEYLEGVFEKTYDSQTRKIVEDKMREANG